MDKGPSATYRGYRRQALYVLSRILLDSETNERIYRPEGWEDLYISDLKGEVIEVVQVKDYTAPLTLSIFEPQKATCFFYRVRDRLGSGRAKNVIASFGTLGPELEAVWVTSSPSSNHVFQKLSSYSAEARRNARTGTGFSKLSIADAKKTLSAISFIKVDELSITAKIHETLKNSIMGASPETSLDLLLWWVFQASENTDPLTRTVVLRKAHEIGERLASLQSHYQEWGRSIVVLDSKTLTANQVDSLRTSFSEGVQTTWGHILADVDIRRPGRMDELLGKFMRNNVIIIHGASGQGKSTLALRYLFENCPDGWRFQVTTIEGRSHALNIAHALSSHAEAMNIPAYILIDVGPNDEGWPDLVVTLAKNSRIKILVVVREEDYRRARFDESTISPEQVDLEGLAMSEAQEIFESITADSGNLTFLNFMDAWNHFGGTGPLMEFTYLLKQGQTLSAKLVNQVEALESEASRTGGEITAKHLNLLALVAVASAYECRLRANDTCAEVGLPPIPNPFSRFEKEYLLRQSTPVGAVGGLHTIRSTIVRDHLLRSTPELGQTLALTVIRLLVPGDMEGFLLRCFSRNPENADNFVQTLEGVPELNWESLGGITRALLWLGASRYEEANRKTLEPLHAISGDGWISLFDGFLGEKDGTAFRSIQDVVTELNPLAKQIAEKITQTSKETAFAPLKDFIQGFSQSITLPKTMEDWEGLAETAFWVGHLGLTGKTKEFLELLSWDELVQVRNVQTIGRVVFGLSQTDCESFIHWRDSQRDVLKERFLRDTESLQLEVSPERTFVKFLIDPEEVSLQNEESSGDSFHDQAIRRIDIMRKLFPSSATYASQGVGLELLPFELPHDPTHKEIPVKSLPAENTVRLNATFVGLVKLRHGRPSDWNDYTKTIMDMRRVALEVLSRLHRSLDTLFEQRGAADLWNSHISEKEWVDASSLVRMPNLPKCAVDEWGFTSDGRAGGTSSTSTLFKRQAMTLLAYRKFLKAGGDFTFSLSLFFTQFREASMLALMERATDKDEIRKQELIRKSPGLETYEGKKRLSLLNLTFALEYLPAFQAEFRNLFKSRINSNTLDDLELHETRTLDKVFGVCRELFLDPTKVISSASRSAVNREWSNRDRFLRILKEGLSELRHQGINAGIATESGRWEGQGALWIYAGTLDMGKMSEIYGTIATCIVVACSKCEFGEWEWSSFHRRWVRIVMAGQYRGRSFEKCAVSIPSRLFFNVSKPVELSPAYKVVIPVTAEDWPPTLLIWDQPTVVLCVRWLTACVRYVMNFQRVMHLFSAAEVAGPVASALQPIEERLSKQVTSEINQAVEAHSQLCDHFRALGKAEPRLQHECERMLKRLDQFGGRIFPHLDSGQKAITLGIEQYVEWAEPLFNAATEITDIPADILATFVEEQ